MGRVKAFTAAREGVDSGVRGERSPDGRLPPTDSGYHATWAGIRIARHETGLPLRAVRLDDPSHPAPLDRRVLAFTEMWRTVSPSGRSAQSAISAARTASLGSKRGPHVRLVREGSGGQPATVEIPQGDIDPRSRGRDR